MISLVRVFAACAIISAAAASAGSFSLLDASRVGTALHGGHTQISAKMRRMSLRGGGPNSFEKLFGSADLQLLGPDGTKKSVAALSGKKVVGLYFSAHWCPPCRGFTPILAEAYKTITGASKSFEIVFISSDSNDSSFQNYFKEMPWLALPFAERGMKADISEKFGVNGIPKLVLIDGETGAIISQDGRSVITSDPTGKRFPWAPAGELQAFPENRQLSEEEAQLVSKIAGRWKPAKEDGSNWMFGMEIAQDGTFNTKWTGGRHAVTDGRVRVLSGGVINLKRTCADANDHRFVISPDFKHMEGNCPQSGCHFTLTRVAQDDESWLVRD